MQYRNLGRTGLKVSEISLGSSYTVYVEPEQTIKGVHKAFESGINFFDTANAYSEAEVTFAKALVDYPRESYVLATKVFGRMGTGPNDRGLSRKHIMEQCDASLKRLKIDYIDVYYCHGYDAATPLEETLRAMDDLVHKGKVLYLGVSNWNAVQIADACAIIDKDLLSRIVVHQPMYNMFNRSIEKDIIPLGEARGIGQAVYSPLAQGLLTGKYTDTANIPSDSRAAKLEWMKKKVTEEVIEKVRRLTLIAAELNISVGQLALAWVLRQSNISSAIIGASRPEQVKENAEASGIKLPAEVLEQIEQVVA